MTSTVSNIDTSTNTLRTCGPCATGVHSACSAVYEGRWAGRCGCAWCHPAPMPPGSVLDMLYVLGFAAYTVRGACADVRANFAREVYSAVRHQFDSLPIEVWANAGRVADAIEAQGEKDYYSRDEVTDALVEAGLDMEWAKSTPFTPKPVAVRLY